jgi:putative peptidoglycan lipid II flippase
VRKVMKLMVPGILGSSVAQINLLFDTLIASFLVTGSVSWLYYADRLVEFPLGIFGVALGTVILPMLASRHTQGQRNEFSATLDKGLRWVLLIGLPAAVGLMLLARPAIATLFQYDDFGALDVEMSGLALLAYGIGLPGFMLVKILAPAFYARQDTRTPVRVAVTAMIANMVMNLLFVVPMVLLGIAGAHAGLALATALASYLNAYLLFSRLREQGVYQPARGWRVFFLQLGAACAALAALLLMAVPGAPVWLEMAGIRRAYVLAGWILAGVATYLAALRLAGVRLSVLWAPGRAD